MRHWTMKDGTKIPIRKMTDSHLANAIALMERWASHRHFVEGLHMAAFASGLQGEMAQDAIEWEMSVHDESGPEGILDDDPRYQALAAERDRRELNNLRSSPKD